MDTKEKSIGDALKEYYQQWEYTDKPGETYFEVATYSGGNDNGWVELTIPIPEYFIEKWKKEGLIRWGIEDYFADQLGYGSFAGNFECSGTIYFDKEKNEFEVSGQETIWEDANIPNF